jgi:hypothetical protein
MKVVSVSSTTQGRSSLRCSVNTPLSRALRLGLTLWREAAAIVGTIRILRTVV